MTPLTMKIFLQSQGSRRVRADLFVRNSNEIRENTFTFEIETEDPGAKDRVPLLGSRDRAGSCRIREKLLR